MCKYLLLVILLLNSCSFITKNTNNNIYDKCGTFDINIQNINSKDSLFYSKLKNALEDKFILLNHNENGNTCIVDILNIAVNNYTPLIDNSGIASRNNKKIDVEYSINIEDKIIKNNVIVFYGSNVSENYYSNYVNGNKIENNDIELLSEKIFYSVINSIND